MVSTDTFRLKEATISSIHAAMADGTLTCRELVEGYLSRIETLDKVGPCLNSIILVNPKALEIADELDVYFKEHGFKGSLHGIPVLLKDNCDTDDMPTTGGSLSLEGVIPATNGFIVQKMIDAGAIVVAKTNLHEFAIWGESASSILGQTLNPYDLTRTPGGSSGGTGASVAANMGTVGIGTDTINSIRSPASACNLVGIRPTLGAVSRAGIIPYSLTQDTAGPITRTLADGVKVLEVISGYDPEDPATSWSVGKLPSSYEGNLKCDGLNGKRIGVLRSFFGSDAAIHGQVNIAMGECLSIMDKQGATLVELYDNLNPDALVRGVSVHLYDLKAHLNGYLQALGDRSPVSSIAEILASGQYHPGIEANMKQAESLDIGSVEYKERLMKRQALQEQVMQLMALNGLDALVFPHQRRLVVRVGESQVERNGVLGSVTGFPSIVMPGGWSSADVDAPLGVPIGIEFLGRPWSEPMLIEIAYGFEKASGFRKPPSTF